jgi:hypothetical protein
LFTRHQAEVGLVASGYCHKEVLDITSSSPSINGGENDGSEMEVYHVLNSSESVTWSDFLKWIQAYRDNKFEIVESDVWLEIAEKELPQEHPARNLLWLWKAAYGGGGKTEEVVRFSTVKAKESSKSLKNFGGVDKELVEKMKIWEWYEREVKKRG